MSDAAILFRPFRSPKLELANRIVMAPMTRNKAPGGVPGSANAAYYRRRAEGGVGLILSEGTVIERPAARNQAAIPRFHGAEALDGWRGVIDAVHAAGGKMGPQVWHVGAAPSPSGDPEEGPVDSPSGLFAPDVPRGAPMSEEDIADTVAAFARAAGEAQRLGFDTLELHGAHGYLIDEYFWPGSNLRSDRYGGPSIGERARFGAEIVAAMRAAVGEGFPILMRLSQWKQQNYEARLAENPGQMEEWLTPLADAGVDIFHCSQRRFWEPEFPEIDGEKGLNFAGWAKRITGLPTISVGSVGLTGDFLSAFAGEGAPAAGLSPLLERMERGEFDLIAVGRALLQDPFWAAKVRDGRRDELRDFDPAAFAELV